MLAARLGKHLVAIHHIGSTAVPGLAAKPIIDILLEVITHDSSDITSALCASGYQARGENGMPGRRYYTKGLQGRRTHHVHALSRAVQISSGIWRFGIIYENIQTSATAMRQ